MRIESALLGALGALGVMATLTLTPTASADPAEPAPAPDSAAGESVVPVAPGDPVAAPAPVPHLFSPQNLPPGASVDPVVPEGRNLGYLRDLWHAVQTQEVTGGDALLLLTQRPMDAYASPPPGVPTGPLDPAPEPGPQ